ncbi:hypothetical protein CH063_13917 [Colletotrichum higginsianum]|uniref:Uncharacterized protein n=2 Tax=Colletotrichum higginsianum TaxID=80884 RepID=H1VWE5_COLHI|nr:hypothetical protein CH63R_01965 [Colletotrichum higginsianum IMI 349063]OBR13239.1 hypothetical protein CH63R_01965 [Colletotrichum higginsianum IMI 349063]TID01875.1 hypothetical protein CH35J_003489 [Colletotrichum higginsianum]GJC96086.1 hypothetical protein ColKHC_04912 [Colletotrichum higginsianum]CCF44557.1 hypothetical protein CH063_13917 [Colletotrichum higginsianum]
MLDENLPTFRFRPSSDNPLNTLLYFTHQGSDPTPSYLLKRADPASPAARNKYAAALTDIASQQIIYAEVLVEPEWSQPTLSAAEVRAQNGTPAPPQPIMPDQVTLQLYNPDSQVVIKTKAGSWGKSDSWEFEMPEQSFRAPSASLIDRSADDPPVSDIVPKVIFRWKRDGRLSKDMTCYMVGKSVAGKKSKEPDITVAMFKDTKHESAVTIYEPNLQRVDVEDRKGLDIVLLFGAEVLRDLFLNPRQNVFNLTTMPPPMAGRRKNSKPSPASMGPGGPVLPVAAMSGAIGNKPASPPAQAMNNGPPRPNARAQWEIDNETKRLQAMVAQEEREARERERRDAEEAKRIKKMLDKEEKERRRKEAEIEAETERLRRLYGVQPDASGPGLPPRHQPPPGTTPGSWHVAPAQPPRPLSAGPYQNGQPGTSSYRPPQQVHFAPQPKPAQQQPQHQQQQQGGRGKLPNLMSGLLQGPYANPAASVSNFFHRDRTEEEKRKVAKKRSVHF